MAHGKRKKSNEINVSHSIRSVNVKTMLFCFSGIKRICCSKTVNETSNFETCIAVHSSKKTNSLTAV
jgi:hypothetical protein